LITNLNRNNIRLTDRTEEININITELILEKNYIIVVLDPVFYLISYLIVKRNIIFITTKLLIYEIYSRKILVNLRSISQIKLIYNNKSNHADLFLNLSCNL
jgi:hypothetical protein